MSHKWFVILCSIAAAAPPNPEAVKEYEAGQQSSDGPRAERAHYEKAVAIDPDYAAAYEALFFTYRIEVYANTNTRVQRDAAKARLLDTYRKLREQYAAKAVGEPGRAVWRWAMGQLDWELGDAAGAEKNYREAVKLDAQFAQGWADLALLASLRGDKETSLEFSRRAKEAEPESAFRALQYAFAWQDIDTERWKAELLAFAEQFPEDKRGAQALYWAAVREEDSEEQVRLLELLREKYPPERFGWSASGMEQLAVDYALIDPPKAAAIAGVMVESLKGQPDSKRWEEIHTALKSLVELQWLLEEKNIEDAEAKADKVKPPGSSFEVPFLLGKAAFLMETGHDLRAYQMLLPSAAYQPCPEVLAMLSRAGSKLGRTSQDLDAELWKIRLEKTKTAPELDLERYDNGKRVKLADYHGKAVLVSFWYPACGPCRNEFPHLQKVLDKYKDRLVILAPNVTREEDEFVMPFLKKHGYGFIPLKCDDAWAEKNYGARGYPTNVLLDHEGQIIFAPHVYDGRSRKVFELQVEAILRRAAWLAGSDVVREAAEKRQQE